MLVSLSLYGLTLRNNFVTDDKLQILLNPNVKDPQNLTQAFRGDVWSFATQKNSKKHRGTNYYRPLQLLTYMAEYSAFGEKSWPWHLMNMVLNAMVVALVYLLLILLAEPALAFWAALLFALHPIHTEAVAWVAALPELECALFLLLALIFYHRARKGTASAGSLAFSTLFLAAALLSKEVALLFPFVLVAYEWFFRGADFRSPKVPLRWISASLAVVFGYLVVRFAAIGGFSPYIEAHRGRLTPGELFVAIPPVFARYIGKLLVPTNLNYFYSFPLVTKFSLATLGGLLLLVLTGALILFFRERQPLLAFSLAWFVLTLAPALSLNSVADNFFAERYLYVPSVGFCIVAATAGLALWRRSQSGAARTAVRALAAAIFCFYATQVLRRIPVFHDDLTLFLATIKLSPSSAPIHAGLAAAYYEAGDLNHALEHGQQSIALYPNSEIPRINLAGYLTEKGRYDEAVEQLQAAIRLEPAYLPPLINLAKVYTLQRKWKQARDCYERAAQLDPAGANYFHQLMRRTQVAESQEETFNALREQTEQRPGDVMVFVHLGDAYGQAGLWKEARNAFIQAAELKPQNPTILTKLGMCLQKTGDLPGAIAVFHRAVKAQPENLVLRQALANALAEKGDFSGANSELENMLKIDPHWEHVDQVHLRMGMNYEKAGNLRSAISEYRRALELNPKLDAARKRLATLSSAGTPSTP